MGLRFFSLHLLAAQVAWLAATPFLPAQEAEEVVIPDERPTFRNAEREAELRPRLPQTFARLLTKQPLHVVVIGDSLANYQGHDEDRGNALKAFPVRFLDELSKDYFLTGGVRIIKPSKGQPDKTDVLDGPEITVHNLSRNGQDSFGASLSAQIEALDTQPQLVILNVGLNDARNGMPLPTYAANLERLLSSLVARSVDVIVAGPTTLAGDPTEARLGTTRSYSETARAVTEALGLLFVDLGEKRSFLPRYRAPETPGSFKARALAAARSEFEFGTVNDGMHPNAATHRTLGAEMHRQLFNPDAPLAVSVENLTWTRTGDRLRANFDLVEQSGQPQEILYAALFPAGAWKPETEGAALLLEGGAQSSQVIDFQLDPSSDRRYFWESALYEGVLHLPLLLATEEGSALLAPAGPIGPIHIEWPYGIRANATGVTLKALIHNRTDTPFEGEIFATWNGQKAQGDFSLPEQGAKVLPLEFALPKDAGIQTVRRPIHITVTANDGTASVFNATIEATRNIGLGQPVAMPRQDQYAASADQDYQAPASPGVLFQAAADEKGLYLIYDVDGIELHESADGPAAVLELQIDARKFETRLSPGSVGSLRVVFPSGESAAGVASKPRPGVFGASYDQQVPADSILSYLSRREDGGTRIAVTLPKALFEGRHPWDLGNGNSQFGLGASLFLRDADGGYPENRRFVLSLPRMSAGNAEALVSLELDSPATNRWSVRLYP